MNNKQEKPTVTDSRRKFLKKTTAGVVITALPAQSVWGACTVSGALSGNASRINDDCETIPVLDGMSPGTWSNLLDGTPPGNSLASKFTYVQVNDECTTKVILALFNEAIRTNITINAGLESEFVFNVKSALEKDYPNNIKGFLFNLAAVYLNIYFEFHTNPAQAPIVLSSGDTIDSIDKLFSHLYALDALSSDFLFIFTHNTSAYTPSTAIIDSICNSN